VDDASCHVGQQGNHGYPREGDRVEGRGDGRRKMEACASSTTPCHSASASVLKQVEASAEGKTQGYRHAAIHRGSPVHRQGSAIRGDRREPAPSSVTPSGRIDCNTWRHCPRPPTRSASPTAPGFGDLAPRPGSALVTLCCRPWSLIARGIRRSALSAMNRLGSASLCIAGRSGRSRSPVGRPPPAARQPDRTVACVVQTAWRPAC
jgi:hypothetical protein